jgi:hypothetical protein
MPKVEEELTGMLVVQGNGRDKSFSLSSGDSKKKVLLTDKTDTTRTDMQFFRNATVKITIEYDESKAFHPDPHRA